MNKSSSKSFWNCKACSFVTKRDSSKSTLFPIKNIFISGFEFFSFNIKLKNTVIKLQIWDTCGQEIYRSLISNFYRNSSLAIIVYSIIE